MTHPHVTDASRGDILDPGTITHPSRSEEAMDRPQVITRQALENPPAEQTTNLQRGQAFAHDGVWAGFAVFPGGASTGWHHHGDYATYGYITSGAMTVEFGPGGRDGNVNVEWPHRAHQKWPHPAVVCEQFRVGATTLCGQPGRGQ
jgi:mannose-6-phosphate isomerase-like protein (cupin superfamily)